jgi:hypothetical protein
MLKITLVCRNVSAEKIALLMNKFQTTFPPKNFTVRTESYNIVAEFVLKDVQELVELKRRLRHVRDLLFNFAEIREVQDEAEKDQSKIEEDYIGNKTIGDVI